MYKILVVYKPNDNDLEKVADGCVEKYVHDWITYVSKNNSIVHILLTSQALVVNYIRYAINQELLDYRDVGFRFKDKEYPVNEYGVLPEWPDGFCDYDIILSEKQLLLSMKKYKEKRNGG